VGGRPGVRAGGQRFRSGGTATAAGPGTSPAGRAAAGRTRMRTGTGSGRGPTTRRRNRRTVRRRAGLGFARRRPRRRRVVVLHQPGRERLGPGAGRAGFLRLGRFRCTCGGEARPAHHGPGSSPAADSESLGAAVDGSASGPDRHHTSFVLVRADRHPGRS
jgi:hypothetical protein